MLSCACYLYDDFALRWCDPVSGKWLEYPCCLWMREHSLGAICDFFLSVSGEVIAVADGIRVVNSRRLELECRDRKIPVRSFATIRDAAEAAGVLDVRFYSIGFGPGLAWRYS